MIAFTPEWLAIIMLASVIGCIIVGFPRVPTLATVPLLCALVALYMGFIQGGIFNTIPHQIIELLISPGLLAIPFFIFMGEVIVKTSFEAEPIKFTSMDVSRINTKVILPLGLIGLLFALLTPLANTTMILMAAIALPLMLKNKIHPSFTIVFVRATAGLSLLLPPSLILIIMSELLSRASMEAGRTTEKTSITIIDMFTSALIPALFILICYVLVHLFQIWRAPMAMAKGTEAQTSEKPGQQKQSIGIILSMLGLCFIVHSLMFSAYLTPTEAAVIGAVGSVVIFSAMIKQKEGNNGLFKKRAGLFMVVTTLSFLILVGKEMIIGPSNNLKMVINQVDWQSLMAAIGVAGLTIILLIGVGDAFKVVYQKKSKEEHSLLFKTLETTARRTIRIFLLLIATSILVLIFTNLNGHELVKKTLQFMSQTFMKSNSNEPSLMVSILCVMSVVTIMARIIGVLESVTIITVLTGPTLLVMHNTINPIWLGIMMILGAHFAYIISPHEALQRAETDQLHERKKKVEVVKQMGPLLLIQLLLVIILFIFPDLVTILSNIVNR